MLDSDNEYEASNFFIPEILVKRFIPDGPEYGTHRTLLVVRHAR